MRETWQNRWRTILASLRADESVKHYLRYRNRSAKAPRNGSGVILCSLCSIPSIIHTYAELLPRFAQQMDAVLEAFHFHRTLRSDPLVGALYASFGTRRIIYADTETSIRKKCDLKASAIFANLRTQADVAAIQEDGVLIGDLIYDTYLRDLYEPTIDIRDPRLATYIEDALVFLEVSKAYFRTHKVEAVFIDHLVYLWQGVVARVAMKQGTPVFTVYFDPTPYVQRVDWAAHQSGLKFPIRYNHWMFPEVFERMPSRMRLSARKKGLDYISQRISGSIHNDTLPGQSAFTTDFGPRVLRDTTVPKILILLHDFCDAVHVFRSLLFNDFYDWIYFLLSKASATSFEWYVKPHPNMNDYRRRGITNTNQRVIQSLRSVFPRVRFLDSSVSNSQIVEEGITSVFTMYGTAGHEFPFLGVPAVCGADNPHSAYSFALTPGTREEYSDLIAGADRLGPISDADRIPEFCYMYYLHAPETMGSGVPIFSEMPDPASSAEQVWNLTRREYDAESGSRLDLYVRGILSGSIPSCVC